MEPQINAVIAVPLDDADDLEELSRDLSAHSPVESRALDGGSVATLLVSVYVASLPLIKAWLIARVERHKESTVSINGRRIHGYSAEDAVLIMNAFEQAALSR